MNFYNAQLAFEYYYDYILKKGVDFANTKALFNIGFTILNPKDNIINTKWRNFSSKYAEREWQWYLKGDPNAEEISNYVRNDNMFLMISLVYLLLKYVDY